MAQQQNNQILEFVKQAIEEIRVSIKELNEKVDGKVSERIRELELDVGQLKSRVTLLVSILAAIGVALLGVIVKVLFPGK